MEDQSQPVHMYAEVATGQLVLQEFRTHMRLELRGVIDAKLRVQAGEIFATIMQRKQPVHLDARQATFADPASWAFIVQLISACSAASIPLHLEPEDEVINAVLQELGLPHAVGAA